MPNRFSTFLVSTSRILPTSIDSIGFSNLTGMFNNGLSKRAREGVERRRYDVRGVFGGKELRQAPLRAEDARMSSVLVRGRQGVIGGRGD